MGSSLRRQLREALPAEIKGLQRAIALEIADDARYDDAWRYDPEKGRRSKVRLADLVRWTGAKDELSVREMLRRMAVAGWEFRVPIGTGRDGRPLYAVPGRAMQFRVPDFKAPTLVGPSLEGESEGPTLVGPSDGQGPTVVAQGPTTVGEGPTTVAEGPTTVGSPSQVLPSTSHKDLPTTTSLSEVPPVAPDVTDGGGGGSDLRSLAVEITAALDYRGKPPGKRLRQTIEDRLTAALAAGWSVDGLAVVLDISGQDVDYPAAVYAHRLDPDELPPTEPVSAPQPFRGGTRGPMPTAADYANATLETVLGDGRRDTADGGLWERAMGRARDKMAVGARGGTDATVAGWDAVKRELAGREHRPYSNPTDDSVYDEPWTVPAPPRPPWCGELECCETDRMRDVEDDRGFKFAKPCEKCHPDRVRAA